MIGITRNVMKKGILTILAIVLLFHPVFIYSQNNKPHLNIPGSKDKLDTEATIQSLLEIEKIPMYNKENEKKDYQIENEILQDIQKYIKTLDSQSKSLYNIKSPFREMVGESSDVEIVEATADRNAMKKDYKVKVIQLAQADSFMSASLPRNQRFSPSQFTITMGEDVYTIRFNGGTIHQLAQVIRDQTDGKIDTRVINDTSTTSVLQIASTKTGAKYKMQFSGDLTTFYETDLITKSVAHTITKEINLQPTLSFGSNRIESAPKSVILVPDSQGEIKLDSQDIFISNNTSFNWSVEITDIPKSVVKDPVKSDNPDLKISPMTEVTVSNIIVEGSPIIPFYEEVKKPVITAVISNQTDNFSLVYLDGSTRTFSVDTNGTFRKLMLADSGKKVSSIMFKNLNTTKKIRLYDLSFVTPVEDGGIRPKNPITRAQDSIFSVDGIQIIREINQVDDVIEGIVIYLKKPSQKEVDLKIDHNYKLVIDSILEWVNTYNQVMEYLSLVTKPNLDRTPLHERAEKDLKKGIFSTEVGFTSLHSKLRTASMEFYPTDYGRELGMLEQIGLFTKKPGTFDGTSDTWESTRMGLLNVDADKLNNMLVTKFDGVKQIFINTVEGSFKGVAWSISEVLSLAINASGFISLKIKNNENKIKAADEAIAKLKLRLGDYETELRIKYGKLNQTLNQTEAQKNYWNNINKQ